MIERDKALDDFYDSHLPHAGDLHDRRIRARSARSAHLLFVAKNLERIGDHADQRRRNGLFAADRASYLADREPGEGMAQELS